MQALTIAIGPAGIEFFIQRLVTVDLLAKLGTLTPPDKDLTIPDFSFRGAHTKVNYSNIKITLRTGTFTGFSPAYKGPIVQQASGKFVLSLTATQFASNYKWHESYHEYNCTSAGDGQYCTHSDPQDNFDYRPTIGLLATDVTLGFEFNQTTKAYDIKVVSSVATSTNVNANIPGRSVVQNQDHSCFSAQVTETTAKAISAIDFSKAITDLIPPLFKSIPASGKLTEQISYDFGIGRSGLQFPADNKGLTIGVTGQVSYGTEKYPVDATVDLPVPPPPPAPHHLQVYVSAYEINALHWAYFKAGLLKVNVTPSQLPDQDVLKVKTYIVAIPSFKPYASFAMHAQAEAIDSPVAKFQEVFQFTTSALERLAKVLPADVYGKIQGLEGDGFVTLEEFKTALSDAQVPDIHVETIRNATKGMGLVAVQNVKFTLTIQNGTSTLPNVIYSVKRTDILDSLALGITGNAQTMKYGFRKVKSEATFLSSTVPGFEGGTFGSLIWPMACEPRYSATLVEMGKTGVPIPIMSGFQFMFDEAQLSIQQGYVSILAKVTYKTTAHQAEPGHAGG
jgi:hypothetical protein